tara:strand:+ start:5242 stop:5661 length:420 start_codon:yes stop_codon:yes gene_type:complete
MKRIKLTEGQLAMLRLNEGRIDIEKTIEPEVNEINGTLMDIAKRLKNMTAPRAINNLPVLDDMAKTLDPLDDRIYNLSNKVDEFNDNPQYTDIDKYLVSTLNGLEFKRRELERMVDLFIKLAEDSNLNSKPDIFDQLFK